MNIKTSIKQTSIQLKQTTHHIKNSWTYNHKHLLITLTLLATTIAPLGIHIIEGTDIYNKVTAKTTYTKQNTNTPTKCNTHDIKCLMSEWVEIRTVEIFQEKQESYKNESRYQALMEVNQLTIDITPPPLTSR